MKAPPPNGTPPSAGTDEGAGKSTAGSGTKCTATVIAFPRAHLGSPQRQSSDYAAAKMLDGLERDCLWMAAVAGDMARGWVPSTAWRNSLMTTRERFLRARAIVLKAQFRP